MEVQYYLLCFAIFTNEISCFTKLRDTRTKNNSIQRLNVLLLVSDDLRPELGCYDGEDAPSPVHPKMHTPNLDKLAKKSLLLKRAYVQQAVCNPSRTSFLTSRRPDTTHIYAGGHFRNITGNFTTLPEYFKQHGYITAGFGKVFHPGESSGGDDPPSWTEPYYHAPNYDLWRESNKNNQKSQSWISVPTTIYRKEPLPDQQIAEKASQRLEVYARQKKPFFMAVGFHKPHLPFVFPSDFIKHYPIESIQLPPNPYAPTGMPKIAWYNYIKGALGRFDDIKYSNYSGEINTSMADNIVLDLRRAYYSLVSYVDSLVGQLLHKIDELGLAKNTIITFLGDHGWQLGEHGEWMKQTNFELATRIPMMVHVPGKTNKGIATDQLVEAVDLYPTIVDAAGLPSLPLCPVERSNETMLCTEGTSLMPLMNNQSAHWKTAVFSQFPRKLPGTDASIEDWAWEGNGTVMGYTMRTKDFRYVLHTLRKKTGIDNRKSEVPGKHSSFASPPRDENFCDYPS